MLTCSFFLVLFFQQLENIENNTFTSSQFDKVNYRKLELLANVLDGILKHRIPYDIEADSYFQKHFRDRLPMKNNAQLIEMLSQSKDGIKASKINTEAIHSWHWKTFRGLVRCVYCHHYLWGFRHQGLQCRVCRISVHQRCLVKVNRITPCRSELVSILELPHEV